MASHFRFWWRSLPHYIGFRHVLIAINMGSIIFFALLLAGCSSSRAHMPSIYIIEQSYVQFPAPIRNETSPLAGLLADLSRNATMIARVGFFGVCLRFPTAVQGQAQWACASTTALLQSQHVINSDPLQLVAGADAFSRKVVFYGLIIAAISLEIVSVAVFFTFPGWSASVDEDGDEELIRPFAPQLSMAIIFGAQGFAVLLGASSILWTHVAAVAYDQAETQLFQGFVATSIGGAAITFGWLGSALAAITMLGIFNTLRTIAMLRSLTEDD